MKEVAHSSYIMWNTENIPMMNSKSSPKDQEGSEFGEGV